MSDETRACDYPEDAAHENGNYVSKCIQCGESFIGHKRRFVCKRCASLPPTPDPRERGVNYAAMMAARDENERDAARVVDAYLADRGVRWSPGAAQMAADILALEALRAPAPSEAVRKFSASHTRAMSELEFTHGVGVRGDAPSEAVAWMVEFKRPDESDWQKSGPHFSYAEAEQDQTRLLLRHWPAHIIPLYTHHAPARGVTVTEAMVDEAWIYADEHNPVNTGLSEREREKVHARLVAERLTAILTPDAEGGA